MLKIIDNWLNQITMYRLILYYVSGLWFVALVLSIFKLLPYTPVEFVVSAGFIMGICLVANTVFARVFGAPANTESVYATALILILIVSPTKSTSLLPFLGWVAFWSMASKYILAINKKHIFNPAAFAVALMALTINRSANWWVSSIYLLPFVLVGGLLMVRKIRRFDMVLSFFGAALLSIVGLNVLKGNNPLFVLEKILFYSPILFFGFAMLTEPMATPPTRKLRMLYGALIGFLFNPVAHIGSFYFTPEIVLLTGNIFSYIVSPKEKWVLQLKEKVLSAASVYDFWFKTDKKLNFKPGQYMEWTLGHESQDVRGMRRYLTIASSPTEEGLMIGVKFYPNSSSFKQSMLFLNEGDQIIVSQLAGEFVMPKDTSKKLVFIAGGIGITPFRSMIKYMLDKNEKRDVILLYSNRAPSDIAYKDIFDQAEKKLGMKTIYTVTDQPCPKDWTGENCFIDEMMIKKAAPDYKERIFYISGTHAMVVAFVEVLQKMGVPKRNIVQDFFPGF
ncbi:MAG: hypothetical protein A2534_02755 [Candidatus Magasanikbacteria bacterium RIFOXYD2_FULL_39_9]|uniref:FAD-binding FR-type domain-containing protein n=1 Tax=Candidatus Magasanikbacteria bacterium RIFOXYD1_FULL_40_23 TaxID=1798705 RepID=A0A1F6P7E6_9BACT|nr:MAG: hypothetical protein A2563_00730 [Candidatus Magasanikbacteria bacterium RIFOXYD1_FULL_40_23]OGH92173.1 MAG: hypothetical protein A2534_02755 [Candidatus Magasanikbacteria bacterium RIFOXYD2_FULL_39_9]